MARRHLFAAALLIATLAACDSGGGDSRPTTTTPATASFPTDGMRRPVIPNPLDATAFLKKPCTSLTPDQHEKFKLDGGKVGESAEGSPKCVYSHAGDGVVWEIVYGTGQGGRLHAPAEVRLQPGVRWVTEILDNYPAIAEYYVDDSVSAENPPRCVYMVGLNDEVAFGVVVRSAEGGQECTVGRQIATDVLSNIKKRQ